MPSWDHPGRGLPGESWRVAPRTFPSSAAYVPEVRHWFASFLTDHVPDDAFEVATLLLSELATNAVRHADTAFTVSAALDAVTLRVEVLDGSGRLPVVGAPAPADEGGRGMLLVDRLAARWGVEPTDGGKRVWFELDVPPGGAGFGASGDGTSR